MHNGIVFSTVYDAQFHNLQCLGVLRYLWEPYCVCYYYYFNFFHESAISQKTHGKSCIHLHAWRTYKISKRCNGWARLSHRWHYNQRLIVNILKGCHFHKEICMKLCKHSPSLMMNNYLTATHVVIPQLDRNTHTSKALVHKSFKLGTHVTVDWGTIWWMMMHASTHGHQNMSHE